MLYLHYLPQFYLLNLFTKLKHHNCTYLNNLYKILYPISKQPMFHVKHYIFTNPFRIANKAACVRSATPTFLNILET